MKLINLMQKIPSYNAPNAKGEQGPTGGGSEASIELPEENLNHVKELIHTLATVMLKT